MSDASLRGSTDDSPAGGIDSRRHGTHIGFDYGTHRIGLSVGDSRLGTARPLTTVANRQGTPDWRAIDDLITQWQPVMLVVGIAFTADGAEQPITGQTRGFMKQLARRSQLPVCAIDEAYSSFAAERELAALRASGQRQRRIRKTDVDSMAATLILQDWFRSFDKDCPAQ